MESSIIIIRFPSTASLRTFSLILTLDSRLLCLGLIKVRPTYPFFTKAFPYGIPDSKAYPKAAAFPDSGTPTTKSASTGESMAKNLPAIIRE